MLTNVQMEERARVGLKAWFCGNFHAASHRRICLLYDHGWDVTTSTCHCFKCCRWWTEWRPIDNGIHREICRRVTPSIFKSLWSLDPVYKLMVEQQHG